MHTSRGFLYIATGRKYIDEALASAASFKATMPMVPIALFTDCPDAIPPGNVFCQVRPVPAPKYDFVDKILLLKESPFDRTVFLDSDTYSVSPCPELFEVLDRFDFAAAHAPSRDSWRHPEMRVPPCYPEFNTGVIAYRNGPEFRELVDEWHARYIGFGQLSPPPPHDQAAFRDAAFQSRARGLVLPPEYNTRSCFPYFLAGRSAVRILHDRTASLRTAIAVVRSQDPEQILPSVIDPHGRKQGRATPVLWSLVASLLCLTASVAAAALAR
jgi:hypothetical protein